MGFFSKHQHQWEVTSRVTDFEEDEDTLEMCCKGCGEVKNKKVASQHQHRWAEEPVRAWYQTNTEYLSGRWNKYTSVETVLQCTECHILRQFSATQ